MHTLTMEEQVVTANNVVMHCLLRILKQTIPTEENSSKPNSQSTQDYLTLWLVLT